MRHVLWPRCSVKNSKWAPKNQKNKLTAPALFLLQNPFFRLTTAVFFCMQPKNIEQYDSNLWLVLALASSPVIIYRWGSRWGSEFCVSVSHEVAAKWLCQGSLLEFIFFPWNSQRVVKVYSWSMLRWWHLEEPSLNQSQEHLSQLLQHDPQLGADGSGREACCSTVISNIVWNRRNQEFETTNSFKFRKYMAFKLYISDGS